MDSDDNEMESFEVTDFDLQTEFNPNRFRKKGSKNQAIYGIWAKDSDDEEERHMGLGSGVNKTGFDPLQDMGFISSGIKGEKTEVTTNDGEPLEEDTDEVTEVQGKVWKQKMTRAQKIHANLYAPDKKLGNWQKHTKGIGEKLLRQMGYIPGKGLGKANQGIVRPVEATKRTGKGSIGAHGHEQPHVSLPQEVDSEADEDTEFQKELAQWKKGPEGGKQRRLKYKYRTADEIKQKGISKKKSVKSDPSMSKVKVIDMTKKEKRVMKGYGELAHQHEKPVETLDSLEAAQKMFEMPELEHNLQLLVDMAEQRIIQHDRELHHEEDLVVNLQHEKAKLENVLEEEEKHIRKMKDVLEILDSCEERSKPFTSSPLDLDECEAILHKLQEEYLDEYRAFEVGQLAVNIMFPLIKKELTAWNPFKEKTKFLQMFEKWKSVVDNVDNQISLPDGAAITVYQRLVWEIWMPHVRRAIINWSVRESDEVQDFLEEWIPVIPEWIKDNILEQLVMPKLLREVQAWDPLTDVVPVHSWIHPWLPLLGTNMLPLYIPIRQKFGNALSGWHPSDSSAKAILMPWKAVFTTGTMDAFVLRHIVPKLAICLQEFVINPYQQHLEPFHWVMAWEDFLSTPALVSLFEKNFFPRWLQVLCSWLGNNPNFEEVSNWFTGWKSLFPSRMMVEPVIKTFFNDALSVMNRAVSGKGDTQGNLAYLTAIHQQREKGGSNTTREDIIRVTTKLKPLIPTTFRDVVEKKAEENGITFMPTNRTYEGKKICIFGPCNIYIEKGVLFMQDGQEWKPLALSAAIDKALGR